MYKKLETECDKFNRVKQMNSCVFREVNCNKLFPFKEKTFTVWLAITFIFGKLKLKTNQWINKGANTSAKYMSDFKSSFLLLFIIIDHV